MLLRLSVFFFITLSSPGAAFCSETSELEQPSEDSLLIEKMGTNSAEERDTATLAVWKKGKAILPLLEEALNSDDPELAERARRLIPRIKYGVPHDKPSVLGDFINNYTSADDMTKGEIFSNFMYRGNITPAEASAALSMLKEFPPHEMESIPPQWALEKYISILNKWTESLLDEAKVKEATELWANVEISPVIRRRYACMLHNAQLPLDKTRFSESEAKLLEAEMALLDNDPGKAETLNDGEDDYITQRIASARFDFINRWQQTLSPLGNEENCPPAELATRWIMADIGGNEDVRQKITERLIQAASAPPSVHNFLDDYPEKDELDGSNLSPLNAAKTLILLGEKEKGLTLVTQYLTTHPIEMGFANSIFLFGLMPDIDITDAGVKEDNLASILEYAEKISSAKTPLPPKVSDAQEEDDIPSEITPDECVKAQKLVLLALYLNSRGKKLEIKPYIMAHLYSTKKMERELIALNYLATLATTAPQLSFEIYADIARNNLISMDLLPVVESLLYSSQTIAEFHNTPNIVSFHDFMQSLSSAPLDRVEKTRRGLVFLGALDGNTPEEKNTLHSQAINTLKEDKAQADFTIKVMIERISSTNYLTLQDIFRFIEELDAPVLPPESSDFLSNPLRVYWLALYAPPSIQRKYVQSFRDKLQFSKLFNKNASRTDKREYPIANAPDDLSHYTPPFCQEAEYGAYLAASLLLDGKRKEAMETFRKARLYSLSDNMLRSVNLALLSLPKVNNNDFITLTTPAYATNNESDTDLSFPPLISASFGTLAAHYLHFKHKPGESCFLSYSSLLTLLSPLHINSTSPTYLSRLQMAALLSRALLAKQEGNIEQCIEFLQKARSVSPCFFMGDFYWEMHYNYPELKEYWEKWHEEDRKLALKILSKWPDYLDVKAGLIETSLLLGKYTDEAEKMLTSLEERTVRNELSLFSQYIKAYKNGDRRKAHQLGQELIVEKKDIYSRIAAPLLYSLHQPETAE